MALFSTFSDNFDDNATDSTLWTKVGSNVTESNGQLRMTTKTSPTYMGYYSRASYDLTGNQVYVELVERGTKSIASFEIYACELVLNSNNLVMWLIAGNNLIAYKKVAGVGATVASTAYSAGTHRWLRIRESGGTIYYDYSSDGSTWNNLTTLANPFAVTALELYFEVGTYSSETVTTTVVFDNFNTMPVDASSDPVRKISQSTQLSWKKDFRAGIEAFTIGSSSIGGSDFIGSPSAPITSSWNRYLYFDESPYVMDLGWERALTMPLGGISIARADVALDNTSGRFTPSYIGGNSELFTSILPRRPIIISAGFNIDDVDVNYPQFVGVLDKQPEVDWRNRTVNLSATDFIGFLENRRIDNTAIYTSQRVDQILDNVLNQHLELATSQYVLDQGIQEIPFALLEAGENFMHFIQRLTAAEMGHFYQDENGILRFENRQHWDVAPFTEPQAVITTSEVLDMEVPNDDHIINVVEVKSSPRTKSSNTTIYSLSLGPIELAPGNNEIFVDFDNPVISASTPSHTANSSSDGSGTNDTSSVTLQSSSVFVRAAKYVFNNTTGRTSYITALTIQGRWAPVADEIYTRKQDDSSVTAYEERILTIENDYIQSRTWADSFSQLVLNQLAEPENLLRMTIRAKPTLSFGDLVSWQGHYWRVFGIKSAISAAVGFVQELSLVQRTMITYFKIGISSIGGPDKIAP